MAFSVGRTIDKLDLQNSDFATEVTPSGQIGAFDPLWRRRHNVRDLVLWTIRENNFTVGFEPIFGLSETNIELAAFESLSEWGTAETGYFHPLEILMTADDQGLTDQLTEALLRTTFQRAQSVFNQFDITFNLTFNQLLLPNLSQMIERVAVETDFPLSRLIVEISEKYPEESLPLMCTRIQELRALGIRIALDDFGTYAAGLNSLCQIPLDIVKVDMSLFQKHRTFPSQGVVLSGIISMCKSLDLICVVEGIETAEDFQVAQACGFQGFQGYHFGRRLRIEKLESCEVLNRTYPLDAPAQLLAA